MRRTRIFQTGSFQITALLAVLFIGSSLILTTAMYLVTGNAMTADFFQSVRSNTSAVETADRNQGLSEAIEVVTQLTASPRAYGYLLLQDKNGTKLAGNLSPMTPVFVRTALAPPSDVANAAEHVILGEGARLPDGNYLFVGADSHQLTEAREHILVAFAAITGVTVLLAIAGGMLLSARVLKRIDGIVEVCLAITANRWDKRVPVQGRSTDTDLLATAINAMLDRLSALMENLRQVSSDIAHDLRTPLTHMRQRLERAQIEARTPEEYAAAMERALADSDEILSIFSALLSLSQIEAGLRPMAFGEVDLSALLAHLAEAFRPVANDHGHVFDAQITPGLSVNGDRALLMQMFANLIENAIRHSPTGARVELHLTANGETIVAQVADTGPGIAAADRTRVFDRFWRAEASRAMPGHGLGLALVMAIAKLHRVGIALNDNSPGLIVRLDIAKYAN